MLKPNGAKPELCNKATKNGNIRESSAMRKKSKKVP
jgi:hypothetical protein